MFSTGNFRKSANPLQQLITVEQVKNASTLYCSFDSYTSNGYDCEVPAGLRLLGAQSAHSTDSLFEKSINSQIAAVRTSNTAAELIDVNGDVPFIISMYLKGSDLINYQMILGALNFNGSKYYNGYRLYINQNYLTLLLYSSVVNPNNQFVVAQIDIENVFSTLDFNSIVLAYNGIKESPEFQIALNGVLMPILFFNTAGYSGMNSNTSSFELYIGGRADTNGTNRYNGIIEELNVAKYLYGDISLFAQSHYNNGNGIQLFP